MLKMKNKEDNFQYFQIQLEEQVYEKISSQTHTHQIKQQLQQILEKQ